MRTRTLALLAGPAVVVAALLTAGCGGGSGTEASPTSPPTEVASSSPSPDASTPASTASAAASPSASPGTTATTPPLDFASFYADHCAACHGDSRDGVGRTPPLTPDALTEDIDTYLDRTDDRTHNSIWSNTNLDDDQRRALIEWLATTAS